MVRFRHIFLDVARLFWLVCTAALWVFWLVSVPLFLQRAAAGALPTPVINGLSPAQLAAEGAASWGVTVATWSWINTAVNGATFLVFTMVAFLIWQRVRTSFGLLTAYILLLGGSAFMNMVIYSVQLSPVALDAWELGSIVWVLFFPWLYLFPNGRAVPRRILWALGPLFGLFASLFLLNICTIFLADNHPFTQSIAPLQSVFDVLIFPMFLLVFSAQVYRYVKVSDLVERQQTRWFIFGLGIIFVPQMVLALLLDYPAELDTISFAALPIGIGISILRYRLWDIDVIIRKTLIYAVLTGLLVMVYLGIVVLLQSVLAAVSGQQSPIVIVVSTLVIAALFAPLRTRVQDVIDRRFFRKKYDAQQVLAKFAQTARDETDMDVLTAELLHVVQEAMQPEGAGIWLRAQNGGDLRNEQQKPG